MRIGEKIRFLRKKKGLTQEELAELANISVFTLRQYESGARSAPRIEQLVKLAGALDTSVDTLLDLGLDFEKIALEAEMLRAKDAANQLMREGKQIVGGPFVTVEVSDMYLRDVIEDAEAGLLRTVQEICGMDADTITEDTASGAIYEKWNPRKIEIVKEYLLDGQAQIKKIIRAELTHDQLLDERAKTSNEKSQLHPNSDPNKE